jgi:hypothetical protein
MLLACALEVLRQLAAGVGQHLPAAEILTDGLAQLA